MITCKKRRTRHPQWPRVRYMVTDFVNAETGAPLEVGDMFYAPWFLKDKLQREGLAPHYWARPEPRRAPLVVVCPGNGKYVRWWCIDQKAYNHAQGGWLGGGWSLSGSEPAISASPSINLVGDYHGFLQQGVLTEDVEGRQYPGLRRTA